MRLKPNISPIIDEGKRKRAIYKHLKLLPDSLRPYFQRPRWDSELHILLGVNGYAIRYFSDLPNGGPRTEAYRLWIDDGDRDVHHIVKHAIAVSGKERP